MAHYITNDNQKILWNTIQKMSIFQQVLPDTNRQTTWFKQIVGYFYEKHRDKRLSRLELENLNRETIEYMVNSLREVVARKRATPGHSPATSVKRVAFQEPVLDFRPESSNVERMDFNKNPQKFVSEYETRQQEYNEWLKRDTPKEVNFQENLKDEVIQNMEELLEQQRKLREYDIQQLYEQPVVSSSSPPPETIAAPPVIKPSAALRRPRKIKIFEESLPNDKSLRLDLEELPCDAVSDVDKTTINALCDIVAEIRREQQEMNKIIVKLADSITRTTSTSATAISQPNETNTDNTHDMSTTMHE